MQLLLFILLLPLSSFANPVEIGTIKWNRDFKEALSLSEKLKKPIFLLFQEVPGCHGCKKFGKEVLSNPTIKKAVEEEFVPLFIYNNKRGPDSEILKKYKEPSWNFQVVRFLDSKGEDLIPRKDKVWTVSGIKKRIVLALNAAGRPVPSYLNEQKLSTAWFSMYCYWTGEMELGAIEGVKNTEAGYLNGREVTKVQYRPEEISLEQLTLQASKVDCARKIFVKSEKELNAISDLRFKVQLIEPSHYKKASASNQKKQLEGFDLSNLNLSDYQLTKLNAFIRRDPQKALSYLNAKQIASLGIREDKTSIN